MDNEKIGKFLQELRKEQRLTQEQLAQKLAIERTNISKWEKGRSVPNAEYLFQLQELFNVSINEILYGERKNLNNQNEIDIVPINIMKDSKRKIKRIFIFSSAIIGLLILAFFSYYFINNYNSIKVYKIYGNSKNFYINDGIMVTSREKSYIKIGSIGNYSGMNILKIRLYFKDGNKENNIFIGSESDSELLLVNRFNYNELYEYKDVKWIINELYLEIITNDNYKNTLKLNVQKDFANNSIVDNQKIPSISDEKENNVKSFIPKYIKENFRYDKKYDEYIREKNDGKYNIVEKYLSELNMYVLIRNDEKIEQRFDYYASDSTVEVSSFQQENMVKNFTYNFKDRECKYGDCDLSLIMEFKENYLKYIYN